MAWARIWRKAAEDDGWKASAHYWRRRAVKAERIAVREVRNRRTIAAICADLIDQYGVFDRHPSPEPVQSRPAPQRPAFDETRARAAADRIAALRAARLRANTTTTADKETAS